MKNIIIYVSGGYKIDNGNGQFKFDGRKWNTLSEAIKFCEDSNLTYEIA